MGRITGFLFVMLCASFGFAQSFESKSDSIRHNIDSLIAFGIQEKAFPGGVLYVAYEGAILIKKAYGFHTYDSVRKVETNHLYDLASITKASAATLALMKLYDDGLIDLNDPLRKHISGFSLNKRGKATIQHSLAHTAGFRSWIPYYQDLGSPGDLKKRYIRAEKQVGFNHPISDSLYLRDDFYRFIKKSIKRSAFDPEKGYQYSGLFFYLVPELVKNLTGQSFDQYLSNNFYTPLGAGALAFNPIDRFPDTLIVPTEIDTFFRMEPIHGRVHDEGAILMGGVSGNAGLFSNVDALARVWTMLLSDGFMDSIQYLSPQVIDLFTASHYSNEDNRRGLGFDKPLLEYDLQKSSISRHASPYSYGHVGYTGPIIWADPEYDLLFIFLCNRVYPNRTYTKLGELNLRPQLHDMVYELIND